MNTPTVHPLKAFRTAQTPRISQATMAERYGVTQGFWSGLETGRCYARPALAKRIAEDTQIDQNALMNLEDNDSGRKRQKRRARARRFIRKSL